MDSIVVYPPGASRLASYGASAIQIGSWVMGDPPANFGAQGLLQSIKSSNALSDGGRFGFRFAPVRQMSLPLLIGGLGSQPAGPNVRHWEAQLRNAVTPGAMISIQLESVTATSEAVFFDVLDGRWEPDYNLYENRAGFRKGTLFVDTQPFGYWPTEILLASAASVGFMGQLAVNGASIVGDVPPLAHVFVNPTVASQYVTGYQADMAAYGLGAPASFSPFISPSAFLMPSVIGVSGSMAADKYAPASVALVMTGGTSGAGGFVTGWQRYTDSATAISSALEPAFRGRYRLFAFVKSIPSFAPFQMIVDAERTGGAIYRSIASSNQLATVYSVIPSAIAGGAAFNGSPAYSLYDMGEMTLPPQASGFQQGDRLRLWLNSPSTGTQLQFFFGGAFLLPVEGAAGILTRGLFTPSLTNGVQGAVEFNRGFVDSILISNPGGATQTVADDGRANFRGVTPRLGASTTQFVMLTGDRLTGGNGATYPVTNGNLEFSQVSITYRPTFQFLAGL